jgi:transposase InsO family protein
MTTSYYADRLNLYQLMQRHPDWTQRQLAQALGRSRGWAYKWQGRFAALGPEPDEAAVQEVAHGLSCAPQHPAPRLAARVEELVLAIRDEPPEGLGRTPGPKAILYYLPRQLTLWESDLRLPTPTRTVYQLLRRNDRIRQRRARPAHEDLPREAPLQCWQLDFKDIGTVADDPQQPTGKQQHVAEALNIVDEGTSLLLYSQVRTDFTAETLLESLAEALRQYGLPRRITLDRDPRSVGAPSGSDFPSALLRFGRALGIQMQVCQPHHPWQNGFVEREHRSYQEECLARQRPTTLPEARAVTATWQQHYNAERPNQALSCHNQPPLVAAGDLPTLPALPSQVEAHGWLTELDGWHVERKVNASGLVQLDLRRYYVDVHRAGQRVTLQVQAATRSLLAWHEGILLKTLPLRGLVGQSLSFERFVESMQQQARALHRLRSLQERKRRLA